MSQTEVQLIKDSTIVNADISNSAAIDVSKVTGAMPLAGGTFTSGVTFTGNNYNVAWVRSADTFRFQDNAILGFGAADDLKIFHDGSKSVIRDGGTGNLEIQATNFSIKNADGSESGIVFDTDSAVELYHNNSKKLETTSSGIDVIGMIDTTENIDIDADNQALRIGANQNFQLVFTGSEAIIKNVGATSPIKIKVKDGVEDAIVCNANGSVELYHNNVKKIETTANGIEVIGTITDDGATHDGDVLFTGASANVLFDKSDSCLEFADNAKARFGTGNDLEIFHNGTNSHIHSATGELDIRSDNFHLRNAANNENIIVADANGAVELYHNNSKKFETRSDGVKLSQGHFYADDSSRIKLGTGDDLQLFHDGSQSQISNSTGNLNISSGSAVVTKVNTSEDAIVCNANGAVELYHNNSSRLETTAVGVNFLGNLTSSSNTTFTISAGGSGTAGHISLKCGSEDAFLARPDGAVELFYNNTKMLETNIPSGHNGEVILAQKVKIRHTGSGNGQIFPVSGNMYLNAKEGETSLLAVADGAVELYFNNSKKFETTSVGATVTGFLGIGITNPDSPLEVLGTGPSLATIHHSDGGTNDEARIMLGALSTNPPDQRGAGISAKNNGAGHDLEIQCSSSHSAGPSTKMTVTSAGLVGIGTTSPSVTLDIEATTPTIRLTDSDASGTPESEIRGGGGDLVLSADRDNENSNTIIGFHTDGSEKLRIDDDGRVLIGATSKVFNEFLSVQKGGDSTHVATFYFNNTQDQTAVIIKHDRAGHQGDGTNATMMAFLDQTNGTSGSISSNGSTTSFNQSSDYRLKENEIAISDGITRLKTLKPYRFNFKKDPTRIVDGFFAHEVQNVIPEAISGEKDQVNEDGSIKPQQIDQSKLVPLLVAAVQELIGKVEVLKTEVAALKAA